MPRAAIVQEYPLPSSSHSSAVDPTLTLDQKIQQSIVSNGIERPKGYTVSWHANGDIEKHHFGLGHPMKPWRLTLTKQLVMAYGMHTAMDCYLSRAATQSEMADFHADEYLDFLRRVTPETLATTPNPAEYNIGDDCPIFDGLWPYIALSSGASLDAARKLCNGQAEIAINWSGGLHHAKKRQASGFCYINDIVLAILQLLRVHARVLYVDIDVHHGDGVEQAFWTTDRVLTVSFHKYDPLSFFPGTGALTATGPRRSLDPGAHHAVNVPLNDGIDDKEYVWLFEHVVGACLDAFRPGAVVLQCGADSLGGDRLGCFNLNIAAHGACLAFVKKLGLPLLVLGGGGYTARNVARLWTYETAVCLGADLSPALPAHTPYLHAFGPDPTLFPNLAGSFENKNTSDQLWHVVRSVREQLRYLEHAPSVMMHAVPPDLAAWQAQVEDELRDDEEPPRRESERESGPGGGAPERAGARTERARRARERGLGGRGQLVD
ncbi:MAG: histone deacetylase [Phylliscum demangeonii]|nr:MAG: histone deacetylase [Phylliscum demangeonii]